MLLGKKVLHIAKKVLHVAKKVLHVAKKVSLSLLLRRSFLSIRRSLL